MKGIIMSMPGVKKVKVRYEERSLDLTFDETKATEQDIIKKIGQEMGLAMEVAESYGARKDGNVEDTCPM